MSGWQTRDPSHVGLDPADYATGKVPVKDASGLFVEGDGAGGGALSPLSSVAIADDALFWTVSPHGSPQAVWDAETGRTWIAYLRAGGDLWATYYDHATGTVAPRAKVVDYPFGAANFHHVPAVMLGQDGRINIVFGGHNNSHRVYRMTNPRDLSAWTSQTLTGNGAYPFAATTDDGVLLFTDRAGNGHGSTFPDHHEFGSLWRSDDDGATWSRSMAVDTSGSPESHSDFYQQDGVWAAGRYRMVWTVARGTDHNGDKRNVYYAAFDPATSKWFAADGTDLGAAVTWADHATCLVATRTSDYIRMSVGWHLGAPVVAFSGQVSGGMSSSADAELVAARWTGATWDLSDPLVTAITSLGPSIRSTPDELLLLGHGPGAMGSKDVRHWRYIDGGWEDAGLLLRSDGVNGFRDLNPVPGGPGIATAVRFPLDSGWPGNNDSIVGELVMVTRRLAGGGVEGDHDHVLNPDEVRDAGRWEVVVDGTAPPVAVTNEAADDWVYGWITESS